MKQTPAGVSGFVGEFGVASATASAFVDAEVQPALADAGTAKNTDTVKNAGTVQDGADDPATLGRVHEGGQVRARLLTAAGSQDAPANLQEPSAASPAGPGENSSEADTETARASGATGTQAGFSAEPGVAVAPVESHKEEQGPGGASTNWTDAQSTGAGPGGLAATVRQDVQPVRRAGARRETTKDAEATAGGVADAPQVPGQGLAALVPVPVPNVAIPVGGQSLVGSAVAPSTATTGDTSRRLDAVGGLPDVSTGKGAGGLLESPANIFTAGSQPASAICAAASDDVSPKGGTARQTSDRQGRWRDVAGAEANGSRDSVGAQDLITGTAGPDVPNGRAENLVQGAIEAAGRPAGSAGTDGISAAPGPAFSQTSGGDLPSTPVGMEPGAAAVAGGVRTASGVTGTRPTARSIGGTEAVAGPARLSAGEESGAATGAATSVASNGASAAVGRVAHQAAPSGAASGASQAKSVDPAAQISPALVSLGGSATSQHLTIRLDPEELGRVQIRIERSGDSAARVTLTAERPQTLELLVRDHAQLQNALDQAGIPAEGRSVTFQLSGTAVDGGKDSTAGTFGSGGGLAGQGGGSNFGARQNGPQGGQSGAQFGTADQPEAENAAVARWLRVGIDITA